MNRKLGLIFVVTGTLLVAGCSQTGAAPTTHSPVAFGPQTTKVMNFISDFSADYIPQATPDKLAATAQRVVEGTVVDFLPGRLWHLSGDEQHVMQSTVVKLRLSKTFKGTNSEFLFVEFKESYNSTTDMYKAMFPVGMKTLVFVEPAQVENGPNFIFDNQTVNGMPAGQVLYRVVSPEAWQVEVQSEGNVVWPLLNKAKHETLSVEEPTA